MLISVNSILTSPFYIHNTTPSFHLSVASAPISPKYKQTKMLFGINFFPHADAVCLPQNDKDNAGRAEEVKENQDLYQWTRDLIGDSPMIDGIPRDEYPAIGWVEGLAQTALRVISNSLAVKYKNARADYEVERRKMYLKVGAVVGSAIQNIVFGSFSEEVASKLLDDIGALFAQANLGTGGNFQEYKDLFVVYKPDKVAYLNQFLRDDIFGLYRVAGPDPLHLRKLDGEVDKMFPELTNDIFHGIKGFEKDNISDAQRQGRLYYLDYAEFDGIPTGNLPDGTVKEGFELYAPTCLLCVPLECDERTSILPISIRCGQGKEYPMYTPNAKHTDPVTWLAAKCTVQVADAVMLECRYHLGRTHLLLETFVCSAKRTLAPNHPLNKFLSIHFEGTALINWLGSKRLAAPGGTIDVISAPPVDTTTALCADAIKAPFSFNKSMPDREFASRGVLDGDFNYPYRDDALLLWAAIQKWVGALIRAYYKSDKDVTDDYELRAWCKEIVDPKAAAIPGFGETPNGEVKTVDYLVKFISTIVFTGSVQHAALNFPQGALMQFVPAMPLVGMAPAPKTAKPFASEEEYVEKMLPDLNTAQRQLNTAELLAGFQWTSLGEYGRQLSWAPDEVDEAVKEFKEDLLDIGSKIQKRNQKERLANLPVYDYLVPKNIPQSTNV